MEQYEYDITWRDDDSIFTEKEELNKMGKRGWILCDTRRMPIIDDIIDDKEQQGTIYYWRRKIE